MFGDVYVAQFWIIVAIFVVFGGECSLCCSGGSLRGEDGLYWFGACWIFVRGRA